jgi:hypothetical protein
MSITTNGCLGASLAGDKMSFFLEQLFLNNLEKEQADGRRPTPVCIWGTHGLGKTEIAMSFARQRGWKIAYCAPAQFEEMGDLHGLPFKFDPNPEVHGDERTVYLPPDWVPTDEGPGLLILDDINRADDRILRGVMQLLQNFEMFSWSMPKKWQILATANPDTGMYSVTPMDDAMLTRMLHVSLVFDAKAWASWAINEGIDRRGVDFVLTYPEAVTGRRTTPRTLTQFFLQIAHIKDLRASIDLVHVLAASTLDIETATAFTAFIHESMSGLPSNEEILGAKSATDFIQKLDGLSKPGEGKRVDLLSTVITRVILELKRKDANLPKSSVTNLIALITSDVLPGDLKFSFHRELSSIATESTTGGKVAAAICKDPDVAKLILKTM